jgi:chromate transporter
VNRPTFGDLVAASARIGCLGFGGPAGQIALMHRVFVEEKRWIDEARYLHALSFCMLLPGPEAQQLATYIGWRLHGIRGGLAAGALFVLPGALVVFALSWLYAVYGQTPWLAAAFMGVKAAVLALVAEALLRIGKRALKGWSEAVIALAAFSALALFGLPFPLVILAAGLYGAIAIRRAPPQLEADPTTPPTAGRALWTAALWGAVWLAPLAAVMLLLGPDHLLSELGKTFSTLAVVTFGGAYAVLAYLQQTAVEEHHWLTTAQMIDGLGLAETTPGPLILVNQFVGFMAGWREGGLALAAAGAAIASWQTFAPSFMFIFAGAPYAEALRRSAALTGALHAITAAVLGVIANLTLGFGLHILFARGARYATPWGSGFYWPDPASLQWLPAVLSVAAGVALIRFKANVLVVIVACMLIGMAPLLAGAG